MDDVPIVGHDEESRLVRGLVGAFSQPAFARRALEVERAYQSLLERCREERHKLLETVRLRLAQLHALIGVDWQCLASWLNEAELAWLEERWGEWQPTLKAPVAATTSRRAWQRALAELAESIERFNRRWRRFLAELDLTPINILREKYNRYYVLEKECALGSVRVARQGFQRLKPLLLHDLAKQFPDLPLLEIIHR